MGGPTSTSAWPWMGSLGMMTLQGMSVFSKAQWDWQPLCFGDHKHADLGAGARSRIPQTHNSWVSTPVISLTSPTPPILLSSILQAVCPPSPYKQLLRTHQGLCQPPSTWLPPREASKASGLVHLSVSSFCEASTQITSRVSASSIEPGLREASPSL